MAGVFLTTTEAATLLGVSVQYVARQFRNGQLPGERTSARGMWRIRKRLLREHALKTGVYLDWQALEQMGQSRRARRRQKRSGQLDPTSQRSLSLQ